MLRRERGLLALTIVAAIVCAAYWALWIATETSSALVLALFFHITSAGCTAYLMTPRRRSLALALGLVVPVFGPLAAALASVVVGRPGADLLHDPHAVVAKTSGLEIARRLTESLPACEALVSSSTEARRQALAKLKARGTAEDVSTLRWARTQPHSDAAVEVALAFEEITARFEHDATTARATVKASPSYAASSALFQILTTGITTGVVDAPLVARLGAEACRHHDDAVIHDPVRAEELLAARVRLELAMHRPEQALARLTTKPLDLARHRDLAQLYFEAAYAARRFDLVPRTSRVAA